MSTFSHGAWSKAHQLPESPETIETMEGARQAAPQISPSALRIVEYVAQHTPLGLVVFDSRGVCGWVNEAAGSVLGLDDPQVLVGRLNWREHCSVPDGASNGLLEQALQGKATDIADLSYNLPRCLGPVALSATARVAASVLPLLDDYGRVAALYVFNRPVRAENPAQTELEERLLRHSIATARRMSIRTAHDFNNIIAVVQGYSSILQNRLKNDPDNQQMVGFVESAAAEALELTNWFSAFGSRRVREPMQWDLNQVVHQFLDQRRGSLPAGVQLRPAVAHSSAPVLAGENHLEQICLHLWENALDAMPRGGNLYWETELLDGPPVPVSPGPAVNGASSDHQPTRYFRLRVRDTGVGMDEATCRLVFEPFFTTKAGRFRGLGLTQVYDMVRAGQGWVQVTSAPGDGTCVDVHLPVPVGAVVGAVAAGAGGSAAVATRRLLVVDDESMIRLMLQEMLKGMGYEVVTVASGEEAVETYLRCPGEIDAVILDMKLAGMSGVETFERLRQLNGRAKIIVSSGDPQQQSVRQLVAQGASGVLAKPFRPGHLQDVIRQVTE